MGRVVSTEELIKSFYDKIVVDYPDLTFSDVDKMCRAEFKLMKATMSSPKLEDFRLKYLFNLSVSPPRILKQLRFMKREKNRINPEKFKHYESMMFSYISRHHKKFSKYESRIKEITGRTIGEIREINGG